MYFWKIKQLKQYLLETGLSQKQLFYYILFNVVSTIFEIELSSYLPTTEIDSWTYAGTTVNFIVPIAGTIAAFYANGGNEGICFAERYFSISLVCSIRFTVLLIPLFATTMIIYWVLVDGIESESPDFSDITTFIISLICDLAFYAYIVKNIRDVASTPSNKS